MHKLSYEPAYLIADLLYILVAEEELEPWQADYDYTALAKLTPLILYL